MSSTNLGKRLTALEEIAEELWLRPYREIAEEHGVPFEELMEAWEAARAETARLRAQGLSDREIVETKARQMGLYPEAPHVNALGRIALAVARMSDYVDAYYWRDMADELEAVVDRYVAMRTLRHRVKVVGAD